MEENLLNLEDYPYNNASKIAAQDWREHIFYLVKTLGFNHQTGLEDIIDTTISLAPKTPAISLSLQHYIMGNIHRAFLILFSLIVIHVLMSSLLCLHHERKVQLLDRNQGRRLLVPFASLSANVNKSTGANKDPRKAAETSLRKAPPSFSNPTQNK
ncbi:hypothetical protein Peur_019383 [Populus x canadensis]